MIQKVIKYKYEGNTYDSFSQLKQTYPYISFPVGAGDDVLLALGIERVEAYPPLERCKELLINAAKMHRNTAEVAPVEYRGNTYDFDTDSRDRLDIALKSLSVQGEDATIGWGMADNTTATITAADIMGVFVTSAVRSNALHEQYRSIKEKIEAAQSVEDLNAIEEAVAYKRLMEEFHLKQDEIAERVSKSRTAVTNAMRLLKLDERVQDMLIQDMISPGHARTLLGIEDKDQQYNLAMRIFDEKLSVRDTEKIVKDLQKPKKEEKKKEADPQMEVIYQQLEERIKSIVGTKVAIQHKNKNKGKIEIEYYSQAELERLIDLFESIKES